jgi:hypothetical protein
MDEDGFRSYLYKGGRSTSAVNRCLQYISEFEEFLSKTKTGVNLDNAQEDDLVDFVSMLDAKPKSKSKSYLWAIRYYFDYASNDEMCILAASLREERIERKPFVLKHFRGVDSGYLDTLAKEGIININQMLTAGVAKKDRQNLANSTGIPEQIIMEMVKLSDLARIPGVKGVRARLYYDAGIDTVEAIAKLKPEELCEIVGEYIAETGFDGIPTLLAEAKFTVAKAKELPLIVEY